MKKFILLLLVVLYTQSLVAQEKKYQLTQVTYEGISKVQKFLDEKKTQEAKALLLELKDSHKIRKKLDKAYVRFYLGYFFTLHAQPQDAIKYFKGALSFDALAPAQTSNAYLNLTQLSMESENYDDALVYLDKVIALSKSKKALYHATKANIYMIQKNYKEVIKEINIAINIDKKPKEPWLKMQYYSYYMLQEYKNAIAILHQLIALQPTDKEYWLQLSSLYSLVENFDNSLATLDISRINNLDLSEQELLQLISWLQYANVPYKAAFILEHQMQLKHIGANEKNTNALGDLYYEAKEYTKAISWYTKAASYNNSSKIYFKIAKIYANQRAYEKVIANIQRSLNAKNDNKMGTKYLLMGKAYYEMDKHIEAKKSFYRAQKFQKSKKMAEAWLDYI